MQILKNYFTACAEVTGEMQGHELPLVEGEVPAELKGVLFRNGNGRFGQHGTGYDHFFDGDGMILRFDFKNGKIAYSNRYVRTREYLEEEKAGKILYRNFGTNIPGGFLKNFMKVKFKNTANTNIIWHGGKLLALWEGGVPHQLDPHSLETLSRYTFGGRLLNRFSRIDYLMNPELAFSAHPKVHPATGELYNFGLAQGSKNRLMIYRVSPEGALYEPASVELPELTFVHDFVLTASGRMVFLLPPVNFQLLKTFTGFLSPVDSISMQKDRPVKILVIKDGEVEAQLETSFNFTFHHANAFEEEGKIMIDSMSMDTFPTGTSPRKSAETGDFNNPAAMLTRYTLHLESGKVDREQLSDHPGEFPQVHPGLGGYRHRYIWGAGTVPGNAGGLFQHLVKYDVETRTVQAKDFYPSLLGEPVFVPCHGSNQEDEGFLLMMSFEPDRQQTFLHVLDAKTLQQHARLLLPHNVPLGFHGTFVESFENPAKTVNFESRNYVANSGGE